MIEEMILIFGLGNPGRRFKGTRHNLGFEVLDFLRRKNKFSNWELKKKLKAKISEGKIGSKKIVLVKPQTFMNNSGKAVRLCAQFLSPNFFVVHDDLDLPLGKMKISIGRGSAGHKGVQSIIDELETKDFLRFRIGIFPKTKPKNIEKFVLGKFNKEEKRILKEVIKKIAEAILISLQVRKEP